MIVDIHNNDCDYNYHLRRAEVTRNIRELSRRMERQLEARQKLDHQLREADSRQLQEFRTRVDMTL